MITPGKYNAEATWIRQAIKAQGIVLMVIKGNDGSGFSVQVDARIAAKIPGILRQVADQMDRDLNSLLPGG